MLAFPAKEARRVIEAALEEDVGRGDVTTQATVGPGRTGKARLIAKEDLVVAGLAAFKMAFELLDPPSPLAWEENCADGDFVAKGSTLLTVSGDSATLLTGERVGLNLLGRLSGIATMTRQWTSQLDGTNTRLVDTRKTTPGLRALEKYAVRCGGGRNHRFGLFDGILIKENHIAAAGSITSAIEAARAHAHHLVGIEVEVTNLNELKEALGAGAATILLDNMDTATLTRAVQLVGGRAKLEASGNMTMARLKEVAATGVDLISAGSLTHSARTVDLSLLFDKP